MMAALKEKEGSSQALLKSDCSLHLSAFNVHTSTKIGQQGAQIELMELSKIDDVLEMHTQDPTFVITLPIPDVTSFSSFILRVFGNPA